MSTLADVASPRPPRKRSPPSFLTSLRTLVGLKGLSYTEAIAAIWFFLDAFTHLFIEGLYLWFAVQHGGAEHSNNPLAFVWREYGRADKRWMHYADVEVLAVEFPTVFLMGPGALLCLYGILRRSAFRDLAIAVVCVVELIGGWYTFAGPWANAYFHPHVPSPLDTSSPWLFYVLLVFMNIVWVIVPGILLWDAGANIIARAAPGSRVRPASSPFFTYEIIAGLLGAYSVLVPTALLLAQR